MKNNLSALGGLIEYARMDEWRNLKSNISKCALVLVAITLGLGQIYAKPASAQIGDDLEGTIDLDIRVLSIDQSVRHANLTIIANLWSPYDLDMENVTLSISNGGNADITCSGDGSHFQGIRTAIWQPVGNSISYPFDAYGMTFEVHVYLNEPKFRINVTSSKITFYGPEEASLESVWKVTEKYPFEGSFPGITLTFSRIETWSILIQAALISMYLLLAGSFFLNLSDLRSRLTVYFTIAAFSLSFIVYMQTNLPGRPFYTLPEFLMITLMSIVAIAAFASMICSGRLKGYFELLPDAATFASSLAYWIFLLFVFGPLLTASARNLLFQIYFILNALTCGGLIWRAALHWKKQRRKEEDQIKPVPYEF